MIREHLFRRRLPADPLFRWRGGEISRLEGFSDGVFAVTLTLLVVSTSVPTTFHELWITIRDLPVFLVCFLLLAKAWHDHYLYFRRYGLEDLPTIALNSAFLFLIVFFAYPLKFLWTFLWRLVLGMSTRDMFQVPESLPAIDSWLASEHAQRSAMMAFYGLGAIGVFGLLAWMHHRAWRLRDALELDPLERHLTRTALWHHHIMLGVCAASLAVLAWTKNPGLSGVVYFALGPLHGIAGYVGGARADRLRRELGIQLPSLGPSRVDSGAMAARSGSSAEGLTSDFATDDVDASESESHR